MQLWHDPSAALRRSGAVQPAVHKPLAAAAPNPLFVNQPAKRSPPHQRHCLLWALGRPAGDEDGRQHGGAAAVAMGAVHVDVAPELQLGQRKLDGPLNGCRVGGVRVCGSVGRRKRWELRRQCGRRGRRLRKGGKGTAAPHGF
jgi:hypothetical protein